MYASSYSASGWVGLCGGGHVLFGSLLDLRNPRNIANLLIATTQNAVCMTIAGHDARIARDDGSAVLRGSFAKTQLQEPKTMAFSQIDHSQ